MVVALIALFVSATGVTWAATKLPADSVKSKQILNGGIKNKDLAPDSVTGANIVDQSVGIDDIGPDSVTADQLADDSVDAFAIQSGAVEADEIAFDAVGADQVAFDAIGPDELVDGSIGALDIGDRIVTEPGEPSTAEGATGENASYRISAATATCGENEELISGYGKWDPDDAVDNDYELIMVSTDLDMDAETVTVQGGNDSGVDHDLIAVAVCLLP
jgi:hypothetical protein